MLRSPSASQSGQMLIVVMMMITTVIIMFGMTVSVGHLVQSKVNLQNSVDLSSMSAASFQARHMNSMSVANYRIRAVLKHFLLDSYVTQARFNAKFKSEVLSSSGGLISDPNLTLAVCQQAFGYGPSLNTPLFRETGRGVDNQTNLCRNYTDLNTPTLITPLLASPIPGFNPLYIAINAALVAIADEFRQSCDEWKGQNGTWARWAVNRASQATAEQAGDMNDIAAQFAFAFGNDDVLSAQPSAEASLSALSTFRSNLIGSILAAGNTDNSLIYLNSEQERILGTSDLQVSEKRFGLAYVDPTWNGGCAIVQNLGGANSTGGLMTQGFSKLRPEFSPDNRLLAGKVVSLGLAGMANSPEILFWPQGVEPVMIAIAAAKPFGSRIGPPRNYFDFEGGDKGWGNVATFPGDRALSLTTGGFGHTQILRLGYSLLPNQGSGIPSKRPKTENEKDAFAQMAYAPTVFDGMYYSIFDSFIPTSGAYSPSDVIPLSLLAASPALSDRSGALPPDPYQWTQAALSLSNHFRREATPSAWSPGAGDERSGYQIKLMSIDDLCNVSTSPKLREICAKEGTRLL